MFERIGCQITTTDECQGETRSDCEHIRESPTQPDIEMNNGNDDDNAAENNAAIPAASRAPKMK